MVISTVIALDLFTGVLVDTLTTNKIPDTIIL